MRTNICKDCTQEFELKPEEKKITALLCPECKEKRVDAAPPALAMTHDAAMLAAKILLGENAAVWENGDRKCIGLPATTYTSTQRSNWRKYIENGNVRWGSGTTYEAALESAASSNWKKYTDKGKVGSGIRQKPPEAAMKSAGSLRSPKGRETAASGIAGAAAAAKEAAEVKVISWNIARRPDAWQVLLDSDADIALLQEATPPPTHLAQRVGMDLAHWETAGAKLSRPWRTAIAKLSDRVRVEWLEPKTIEDACPRELAVSRLGTLAAATVTPATGEPFVVVSMYAPWEKPYNPNSAWNIYADASAHRVISDLTVLIGREFGHRIIAAGDLNILYGYGEHGSPYWAARYATIFDRMRALRLSFVGPQVPGGRSAEPWPNELPLSSKNVPTYYHSQQRPISATRQLDFVFASESLGERVRVTALNDPEQWGPSDHCRIEITIGS